MSDMSPEPAYLIFPHTNLPSEHSHLMDFLALGGLSEATKKSQLIIAGAIKECPICALVFGTQQQTQEHVLQQHPGQEPFGCIYPGCTKKYDTIMYYKRHLKASHGVGPRRPCPYNCGKLLLYRRPDNFKLHVQRCPRGPVGSASLSPVPSSASLDVNRYQGQSDLEPAGYNYCYWEQSEGLPPRA